MNEDKLTLSNNVNDFVLYDYEIALSERKNYPVTILGGFMQDFANKVCSDKYYNTRRYDKSFK